MTVRLQTSGGQSRIIYCLLMHDFQSLVSLQNVKAKWKIGKEITIIESNEKIDMVEGDWMCDISYFHFSQSILF